MINISSTSSSTFHQLDTCIAGGLNDQHFINIFINVGICAGVPLCTGIVCPETGFDCITNLCDVVSGIYCNDVTHDDDPS